MGIAGFAASLAKEVGIVNAEHSMVKVWLDTGLPNLNEAISGRFDGGMPCGRIVEVFGPSSSGKTAIATACMIAAQQIGGLAIYCDHERSFDQSIGERNGLNIDPDCWIFMTPKTFEESVNNVLRIGRHARSGSFMEKDAPIVVVFDSLAAMVPQSKMAKDVTEQGMNDSLALAKATSSVFPVLAQIAEELNMLILVLNQVRQKPGVCLRGDVMIPFTDGTAMQIKDIVEKKISKNVWSWNEETNEFEEKPITQWHDNGEVKSYEDWTHIRTTGAETRNGVKAITATNDHLVMVDGKGWTKASEINVGDKLLTRVSKNINGSLREFLGGIMFGDSSVKKMGARRNTAQIRIQDNVDLDYAKWKVETLSPFFSFTEYQAKWNGGSGVRFDSEFSHELMEWIEINRNPLELIRQNFLTPQALAIWIMDDACLQENRRYCLSIKRIKDADVLDDIADALFDMGYRSRVRAREGALIFDAESTRMISKLIAKYVPDCMSRKILSEDRGQYAAPELSTYARFEKHLETVVSVGKPGKTMSSKIKRGRYDIGVEDNHSYLAGSVDGGFLVHNCYGDPMTTPGGEAPRFYSSVRIQLAAKRLVEGTGDEKEMVGQGVTAKCIKNKVSRPFREASWKFRFKDDGTGYISKAETLMDYLIDSKKLECTGPRVKWTDGKTYFKKAFIEKIEEEGLYDELKAMLG